MSDGLLRFRPTDRFYTVHAFALLLPVSAGIFVFGWRAAAVVTAVVGSAVLGQALWKRIGRRGRHVKLVNVIHGALLLSCLLPAHLASSGVVAGDVLEPAGLLGLWPILPAAGLLLATFSWLTGGEGGGRIHPAVATYLLLVAVLGASMTPTLVLRRDAVPTGDLLQFKPDSPTLGAGTPWVYRPGLPPHPDETGSADAADAIAVVPASVYLSAYTSGIDRPERLEVTLGSLLRDRMPPLEDLIVGGHPAPAALAGAVFVIAGGLLLIFRGVIDPKIPVLTLLSAYATFLLLPVPASITRAGPQWAWPVASHPGVGWDVALTFVHYEMLAGPGVFVAFFVAPLPSLRPLADRWRVAYAVTLGMATAGAQLYLGVQHGPIIAVAAVAMLTPVFDRLTRARPLV